LSQNGQRGSLLFCNWLHSVRQNHFYVMILLNKDSAIQRSSRRFCTVYKSEKLDPLQPSGRRDIPSGRPTIQSIILLDDENFSSEPSCVAREASNCSSLHPSRCFSSTSGRHSVFDQLWDFFLKNTDMGRSLQPSGQCGFPSGRVHP
jgi:hypothetical protein